MAEPAPVGAPAHVDSQWLRLLPKAEVHVHVEGCVPLAVVGLVPADAKFRDLASFLGFLDRSCGLVTDAAQLRAIACGIAERAAANGVRHVDVIVNPSHWPAWRGRLAEMLAALDGGFCEAEQTAAVTVAVCVSLLRTQAPAEAESLVDWLVEHRCRRVVGLSIDGDEAAAGASSRRFAPLFEQARIAGLRTCAHAGESSGPAGVRDALDLLHAERIDHGVRAAEDHALVVELAQRGTPLDICPTSNVRLGVVESLAAHPLEPMRRAGVAISINTDDPLLFGCDVVGEYERCATTFGWDRAVAGAVARTSIDSCFASDERRAELRHELDAFLVRSADPSAPAPSLAAPSPSRHRGGA
ncbi:MAG: adenosine deaminase [Actinomycetota bacterium]|jgi:adenosine deaminase|nr:adenosine deaminase [Actinomycetota bacterium]